jgi:hypothetical protein
MIAMTMSLFGRFAPIAMGAATAAISSGTVQTFPVPFAAANRS